MNEPENFAGICLFFHVFKITLDMFLSNSFVQTGHRFQFNEILRCSLFSLIVQKFGHRQEELHALENHLGFCLLGASFS